MGFYYNNFFFGFFSVKAVLTTEELYRLTTTISTPTIEQCLLPCLSSSLSISTVSFRRAAHFFHRCRRPLSPLWPSWCLELEGGTGQGAGQGVS
jgi:hypothetical protein